MSATFVTPTTLDEVFDELTDDDAHVFAGGQSLVLLMNTGLFFADKLVSLARVPGLRDVRVEDGKVHLGAMCTHDELSRHPAVAQHLPAAVRMFRGIGNVRVRAAGTLGGNIVHADPAQDPPVLFTAMGGYVTLVGPDGQRRVDVADVSDFPLSTILEPDEVLTSVVVPVTGERVRCTYEKFLPGTKDDYATVSMGARVTFDDAGNVEDVRLAAGAIGGTVVQLHDEARAVVGGRLDDEEAMRALAEAVRESVSPYPDRRGSADYKRHLAGVVAVRALRACGEAR